MAELGKIWWKRQSNILYIRGDERSGYTLYDQNISGRTCPWQGNSSSMYTTLAIIENTIKPLYTHFWFGHSNPSDNIQSVSGLENIDTSEVTDMSFMFGSYWNESSPGQLTYITDNRLDLRSWDTSKVTNMDNMFSGCKSETILVSGWDTSKVTNMGNMFLRCTNLTSLDLSSFDFSNVTVFTGYSGISKSYEDSDLWRGMFCYCNRLTTIRFPYDSSTSKVTDMSCMFNINSSLTTIDLSCFDTSSVTDMYRMFKQCSKLESLDLSSFDLSNVENTEDMFYSDSLLKTIYVRPGTDWSNSAKLTKSTDMFGACTQLVGENGTAHGTSTTAAHNNKTRARIDKTEEQGYFTTAKRTVDAYITGMGTVIGSGEYVYGSFVQLKILSDPNYYTNEIILGDDSGIKWSQSDDTINESIYSFEITRNTTISVLFTYRNEYTLTVNRIGGEQYRVDGAGTYKYLDRPIVIVDMNEASLSFDGWYENDTKITNVNPYEFTMPNSNYTITAVFTDSPFADINYRQFIITNGNNEKFKLAYQQDKPYLSISDGLGFKTNIYTNRIGLSEEIQYEVHETPKPNGTLYFYNDSNSNIYKKYNEFVRFLMIKPLTLWYKIPIDDPSVDNTTYHIPIEVIDVGKVDIDEKINALICPISFYGLGFWKETQISFEKTSSNIEVFNDSDFDCGIKITLKKENSTSFTNPEIIFKERDIVYGKCKIGGTYDKIVLNSINKEEGVELYLGETLVEDSFNYIDFSSADGKIQFPFPKLKNGVVTTIEFNYDNSQNDNNIFTVIYDKEYISV